MNAKKLTQKKTLVYFFKNVDQSVAGFYYEMIIGILALVAFINAFKCIDFPGYVFEHPLAFWFNQLVLLIFTFDYIFRLIVAEDKKNFFKKNLLLFIAILPFSPLFRIARLIRIGVYFSQFHKRISRYFISNTLVYSLYSVLILLIGCALLFYHYEKGITVSTFGDSLWWAIVTATTVGYGDYIPATNIGRIIASVLMMSGVVFFGILTTTFTTYMLERKNKNEESQSKIIDQYSELSEENREKVNHYIASLGVEKNRKNIAE